MAPDETPSEARRLKDAEKAANVERFEREIVELTKPLPDNLAYPDLVAEHQRLRMKIMEMQGLVIKGRFDFQKAQEFERILVGQIHKIEERAHGLSGGAAAKERPGPPPS